MVNRHSLLRKLKAWGSYLPVANFPHPKQGKIGLISQLSETRVFDIDISHLRALTGRAWRL
jgi:hypothetical protein